MTNNASYGRKSFDGMQTADSQLSTSSTKSAELLSADLGKPEPEPAAKVLTPSQQNSQQRPTDLLSAAYGDKLEFPLHVLPKVLRPLIERGAHSIQCPAEFIALPLLAGLGAAIGRTRKIKVKEGWLESSALWVVIVGAPGAAKTPAFNLATGPLVDYERGGLKALGCFDEDGEAHHLPARIKVADITMEALAVLMEHNPRGLILVRDELSGWVSGMNQYKVGKGSDMQFYLTVWSGGHYTVDRKSLTHPIILSETYLAIAGGVQTGVLQKLLQLEHQLDGFASRLLISCPPQMKLIWTQEGTDEAVKAPVRQVYAKLLRLGFQDNNEPVIITWTPEAYAVFENYMGRHRQERSDGLSGTSLQAAWAKLECYLARFCLIVQMVRWAAGETQSINVEPPTIEAASALIDYFKAQELRFYKMMPVYQAQSFHERILSWAVRNGKTEIITPRDLLNAKLANDSPKAQTILRSMAEAGLGKYVNLGKNRWALQLTPAQHSALSS